MNTYTFTKIGLRNQYIFNHPARFDARARFYILSSKSNRVIRFSHLKMASSSAVGQLEGTCKEYLELHFPSAYREEHGVQYHGFVVPASFPNLADRIRGMEVRADDVWVSSVPKSGE